jgi:hypothetical protein
LRGLSPKADLGWSITNYDTADGDAAACDTRDCAEEVVDSLLAPEAGYQHSGKRRTVQPEFPTYGGSVKWTHIVARPWQSVRCDAYSGLVYMEASKIRKLGSRDGDRTCTQSAGKRYGRFSCPGVCVPGRAMVAQEVRDTFQLGVERRHQVRRVPPRDDDGGTGFLEEAWKVAQRYERNPSRALPVSRVQFDDRNTATADLLE